MTTILKSGPSDVLDGGSSQGWNDTTPQVATFADGSYVIVWESAPNSLISGAPDGSSSGIFAQRFAADGTKIGAAFQVDTTTAGFQEQPAVAALSDGSFVIAWLDENGADGDGDGIVARHYNANGTAQGNNFVVDSIIFAGAQLSPSVTALTDGAYAIAYTDLNFGMQVSNFTSGNILNGINNTFGATTPPAVAYTTRMATSPDGNDAVVWSYSPVGSGANSDVYFHSFAGNTTIEVNQTTTGIQNFGSITALTDGSYIVAWQNDPTSTNHDDIFIRHISENGAMLGDEMQVNTQTTGSDTGAKVAALTDGGFEVVWQANSLVSGGGYDIYGQRYDDQGNKIGDEVRITATSSQDQLAPDVAALPGGGFVVTWETNNGAYLGDIHHRVFSAATDLTGPQTVYGSADPDTLDGGQGADTMYGGVGDDTYIVNSTGDVVVEHANEGYDTVMSGVNYTLGDNVEALILTGMGPTSGTGNDLGNVITGNAGNNVLNGGLGNDVIHGGDGNDYINDTGGYGQLFGDAGNDTIYSSPGNNYMDGGSGDDLLVGFDQNDQIYGGDGGDTIQTYSGTDYADGGAGDDIITGGPGAVTGNKTLIGGTGNDTLQGGLGNDIIYGGDQNDIIIASAGKDFAYGGDGTDTFSAAGAASAANISLALDRAWVGGGLNQTNLSGFENITGSDFNDTLNGDSQDNVIDGGAGNDRMFGGAGDDTYIVDSLLDQANEIVNGVDSGGHDTVIASISYTITAGIEELDLGGTGNINATGNSTNDLLVGNSGNNILTGGGGTDTMYGMGGDDTYVVDDNSDVVSEESLGTGIDDGGTDTVRFIGGGFGYTLGNFIENLDLSGGTAVGGTGNSLNNTITGNSSGNLLFGMAGNDVLIGNGGNDQMFGGAGNDTYVVDNTSQIVSEESQGSGINDGGHDVVQSSVTWNLGNFIEDLTLTGTAAINGTGNALSNAITGNAAANTLFGLGGNDTLDGGAGADHMFGGAGDDAYYVDNAGDIVSEQTTAGVDDGGNDAVFSSITYTLPTFVENLALIGTANINGIGNAQDNIIIDNSGNNYLRGMAGNDLLEAIKGGTDYLYGGAGNDTYYVINASDVAYEQTVAGVDDGGTDTVVTAVSYTIGAFIENLTLDSGNIDGTGNTLANTIIGSGGANHITGLGGNDILTGGSGSDTFVFSAPSSNGYDTITDFASGTDKLGFKGSDYGHAANYVMTSADLHNNAAVGSNAQFVFDTANHILYWDTNGSAANGMVALALMPGVASLALTDFVFT